MLAHRLDELTDHNGPGVSHTGCDTRIGLGQGMEYQPGNRGDNNAHPPREAGADFKNVFHKAAFSAPHQRTSKDLA
jgi:hypothetical protein